MTLTLFTFGKLKTPGLAETRDHYLRGLQPWVRANEIELKAEQAPEKSDATRARVRALEATSLRAGIGRLSSPRRLIALDESGRAMTSREWARMIEGFQNEGVKDVALVIGGGLGLDRELLGEADRTVSLGPQTLSHDLARVVLWEQIYRAFSILKGHPYHND